MIEGFDNYTAIGDVALGNKGNASEMTSFTTGRSGSGQAGAKTGANYTMINFPFPEVSTVVIGFALRLASLPTTTRRLVEFSYAGTLQCSAHVDSSGYVYMRKASLTTDQVISTIAMSANTWHFFEMKAVIHDTTGSLEVKLDGVSLGEFTGDTDQANSTGDLVSSARIHTLSGGVNEIDDIYILDTTGSLNTDFLGDCSVETIRPDGAGANTDWTPLSGANYTQVDETLEDGDTTYVSASTVAAKDTYTFAAIASANTDIRGVGVTIVAERQEGGERALTTETIDGANVQTGAAMYIGSSQYAHYQTIHETYDGTNQWTVAKVDGGEFGVSISV